MYSVIVWYKDGRKIDDVWFGTLVKLFETYDRPDVVKIIVEQLVETDLEDT